MFKKFLTQIITEDENQNFCNIKFWLQSFSTWCNLIDKNWQVNVIGISNRIGTYWEKRSTRKSI